MIGDDGGEGASKIPIPPIRSEVGTYSDMMLHSLFRILRYSITIIVVIGLAFMAEPLL